MTVGRAAPLPAAPAASSPRRPPVRAVAITVVLVVWGLMTHGTFAGSGDEPHYLVAAQSLAFDGDFDLTNNYAMPGNLIGGGTLVPDGHARAGRDGVLRPAHDVGLPILFAPIVRVAYPLAEFVTATVPARVLQRARLNDILIFRHLIGLCMAGIAAALAVQLLHLFRRTAADRTAAGRALLLTLSPPVLSHGFLFFTELPSAVLILWLFRRLTELPRGSRDWAVIGLATGLLFFIHARNLGAVVVLGIWAPYVLWTTGASMQSRLAWLCGAAAVAVCRTALLFLFWGTWLTSPLAVPAASSQPLWPMLHEAFVRTSGLLFDQEFGLLVYAPIYLLALPGLWWARRDHTAGHGWAVALFAAYFVTIVVPFVNIHGWTGGWAPAARMITPVVPLLGLSAFACACAVSGPSRVLVTLIVALQLLIDVVVWQWPKSLWNYGDGSSALLPAWLSAALPAWHGPAAAAWPFLVSAACWLIVTWWLVRPRISS